MTQYAPANLPATGIPTFLRSPACLDVEKLNADIGIFGVPYDAGTGNRPGTRFGPRELRAASGYFGGWGDNGYDGFYDIYNRTTYLNGVRIGDCGDVDVAYYDLERNFALITEMSKAIQARNALPVAIGGDHSITFPLVSGFEDAGSIDILHIDAHLDWVDVIGGVRYGNASNMRRCMEQDYVRQFVQLGVRDGRSRQGDDDHARSAGAVILTRHDLRKRGIASAIDELPRLGRTYISVDIDAFDPSVAPGTSSPAVDGFLYHEMIEILDAVLPRCEEVVGIDLVEINPMVDLYGQTARVAASFILDLLGRVVATDRSGRYRRAAAAGTA